MKPLFFLLLFIVSSAIYPQTVQETVDWLNANRLGVYSSQVISPEDYTTKVYLDTVQIKIESDNAVTNIPWDYISSIELLKDETDIMSVMCISDISKTNYSIYIRVDVHKDFAPRLYKAFRHMVESKGTSLFERDDVKSVVAYVTENPDKFEEGYMIYLLRWLNMMNIYVGLLGTEYYRYTPFFDTSGIKFMYTDLESNEKRRIEKNDYSILWNQVAKFNIVKILSGGMQQYKLIIMQKGIQNGHEIFFHGSENMVQLMKDAMTVVAKRQGAQMVRDDLF